MSRREVSRADVIVAAVQAALLDVHTVLIARVTKVYPAARKVDVQPVIRRVLQTEEGEPVVERLPMLTQVPIGALRAGKARIDLPVAVGCWVTVIFFEDNVGKWLAAGGSDVSPGDIERHGLTGAVALPILYPDAETKSLPALSATDIVIALTGGPELRLTPTKVQVTGDLVVTGEITAKAALPATAVKLSTHLHNTAMGPSSPPTAGT